MSGWLGSLLSGILGMSVLTLGVILALPLLSRRYRLRTVYGLLILCLIGFLIPWRPLLTPRTAVTVELPADTVRQLQPLPALPALEEVPRDAAVAHPASDRQPTQKTAARPTVGWRVILLILWATGAAAVLGLEISRYIRFRRLLSRWREPAGEPLTALLREEANDLSLKRLPSLWTAPGVSGPMVLGLIAPAIYLPGQTPDTADLRLILRHELTHIQQGDLPVKWLTLLVCAAHWPNPVVWLLRRALNQYCELSCDERVMAGSDLTERTRYSESMIAAVRVGERTPTVLCTAFRGGLKRMKRRILHIMDTHSKRIGAAAVAALLCLAVLAGSLMSFSEADAVTKLPEFPENYDYESEELISFSQPYPAIAGPGFGPAYNYSDDPQYPAALYAPGTPLEITGHKWRSEHIPDVTGRDGMVWLQVNVLAGERLDGVWMPETFVELGGVSVQETPKGTLKVAEGQTQVPMYSRITDRAPTHTFEAGREAELISWQPGYAQISVGGYTGYVAADQLLLSPEITASLSPAWMYGFDSWRLGYGEHYRQYLAWFGEMENRYGSNDFWSNENKALMTDMQREYGLLQPGAAAFTLPQEGDITADEAIAIGKRLISDNGGTDELGIPYYAWQAYFMYTAGRDEEPYWMLRAWATHTDMDRQNIRLTRTGELMDISSFRDDPHPDKPYYSISLNVLYGETEEMWPPAVRSAYDPEGCPPLRDGWKTEAEVRSIAMDTIEAAFGADKRAAVEDKFEVYASYYNYGRAEANAAEERIFWTVHCVNRTPGEAEDIEVQINMDGSLRVEPIDNYYGDIDFTPGGNG